MKHERNFVKAFAGCVVDNAVFAHIAEKRNFLAYVVRDVFVAACDNNVRVYADCHKLFYGLLGRLAFEFIAARNIRHKADVDKQTIAPAYFKRKLADCFKKGLAFDIADCAAYFYDAYVCA